MPNELGIQCNCGAVRGVVDVSPGNKGFRVVCYCDDCQAFANFLAPDNRILDAQGGTDIFQMSPAGLKITQGLEKLACLRLTPKGPLRWYTACCQTPIGNTPPSYQAPFVGLIHSCMRADSRSLDEVLGPVSVRSMGRYAKNAQPPVNAHSGFSLSHIVRMVWKLLVWRVRGDHKRSPFFNAETGKPVAAVRVPGQEERVSH